MTAPPSRRLWRAYAGVTSTPDSARWALSDLVQIYALAVDDGDLETVIDTYQPDGVFIRAGVETVGAAALTSFYATMLAAYRTTLHIAQSQVVAVRGDVAEGVSTGQAELVLPDDTLLRAAYRYHDEYRRTDGVWRFSRRELRFQYMLTEDEMSSAMGSAHRIRRPGAEPAAADYPETLDTWRRWHPAG